MLSSSNEIMKGLIVEVSMLENANCVNIIARSTPLPNGTFVMVEKTTSLPLGVVSFSIWRCNGDNAKWETCFTEDDTVFGARSSYEKAMRYFRLAAAGVIADVALRVTVVSGLYKDVDKGYVLDRFEQLMGSPDAYEAGALSPAWLCNARMEVF